MKNKRIYLDNCCFNRPFDNQEQIRIQIETEAKLYLQEKVYNKDFDLAWSYILDFENSQNPFSERKNVISSWKKMACIDVEESEKLLKMAKKIMKFGVKPKDALHIACAMEGDCLYFFTTDDNLIKKMKNRMKIKVMNPVEFVANLEV